MRIFLSLCVKFAAAMAVVGMGFGTAAGQSEADDPVVDWQKRVSSDDRLTIFGDDVMGDSVDPHMGSLTFEHTDVSIPGNNGLSVAITRRLSQGYKYDEGVNVEFGDWELVVPKITSVLIYRDDRWKSKRCSGTWTENFPTHYYGQGLALTGQDYSDGVNVMIPGQGSQPLLKDPSDQYPTGAKASTASEWYFTCTTASDGGEGFIGHAPNGDKYIFNKVIVRDYKRMGFAKRNSTRFERQKVILAATQVEDVHGNTVTYTYTGDRLTQISSSDGRVISLSYKANTDLIETASANGREWHYAYRDSVHHLPDWDPNFNTNSTLFDSQVLDTVTQPDGHFWEFDLDHMQAEPSPPSLSCERPFYTVKLKHPYGLRGTYNIRDKAFRQVYKAYQSVVEDCFLAHDAEPGHISGQPSLEPPYQLLHTRTMAVTSKSIGNKNWTFSYRQDDLCGELPSHRCASYGSGAGGGDGGGGTTNPPPGDTEPPEGEPDCKDDPNCQGPLSVATDSEIETTYTQSTTTSSDGSDLAPEPSPSQIYVQNNSAPYFSDDAYNGYDFRDFASRTRVTQPNGTVLTYYHLWNNESVFGGKLIEEVTTYGSNVIEEKHYNLTRLGCNGLELIRSAVIKNLSGCHTPQRYITTQRDGDTLYQDVEYNLDGSKADYSFGKPVKTSVSTNVSTTPRVTETTYKHFPNLWIIGLEEEVFINDRSEVKNTYDPNTGNLTAIHRFGEQRGAFGYFTSGTAKGSVKWAKDGRMLADSTLGQYEAKSWHRGIVTEISQPDGSTYKQTVDDNGWVMDSTNARGFKTEYERDNMGRLKKYIPPARVGGGEWLPTYINYVFSGSGAEQTITKGDAKTTVTYDSFFRPTLVKTEDLSGTGWFSYVNTAYDAAGRERFTSFPSTDPDEANGTKTNYDGLNRAIETLEVINGAENILSTTEYLPGHITQVTDAENHVTKTYKNGFDEVVLIEQPEDTSTEIIRNIWGQIDEVRQFGNSGSGFVEQVQKYVYNNQQRLCRHETPSGGSALFAYDAGGYVTTSSRGHGWANNCAAPNNTTGSLTTYSYDAMGRLEVTDYADPETGDIVRDYDANGNLETLSRALGTSRENIWVYAYNELDMLTSETLSIDNKTFPLTYNYNPSGHMHDSMVIETPALYELDGLGRHLKLHRSYDQNNLWSARNITYHANGMLNHMDYRNGHNLTQTLNARQQLDTLKAYRGSNATVDLSYDYDARGLITSITDLRDSTETRAFTYDGQGRLKTASGPWGDGSYNYDALGNILSKSFTNWKGQGQRDVVISYDEAKNRVTGYTDSQGPDRLLGYDARGNVTTLGDQAFIYDAANQPRAKTNGTYIYDGNMKRVKSYDGETGETIYNVFSQASGKPVHIEVHKANGMIQAKTYRYVAGKRITRFYHVTNTSGGTGYNMIYFHEDHLGSPLVSSNPNGNIRWRESYSPFGEGLIDPSDNYDQPGFTGHIKDRATGLNYMQARYYDPVMGRFLSIDPVTLTSSGYDPRAFNRYAYSFNDPINHVDPDGEFAWLVSGAIAAGLDVAVQLATKKPGESINWAQVGASGLAGAAGVGIASKAAQLGKIAAGATNIGGGAALNASVGIVGNLTDGDPTTEANDGILTNLALGAAGTALGGIAETKLTEGVANIAGDLLGDKGVITSTGRAVAKSGTDLVGNSVTQSSNLLPGSENTCDCPTTWNPPVEEER